jgi:type I restriction enzyme S subunit
MSFAQVPLSAIADINRLSLPETTSDDEEIEYADLSSVNLEMGTVSPESMRFSDAPTRARRVVRAGDSLIPYLTGKNWIATQPLLVDEALEHIIFSTGYYSVSPRAGVDSRFLNYALGSLSVLSNLEKASQGVTMVGYPESALARTRIPHLSLAQQIPVAGFLDRETQRIDEAVSSIENLRDLTKQRLEAQIAEEIARIAGRAPRVPLKRIVDPARPLTYGIVQAGDDVPGGVPYVRPMDMVEHTGVPDPTALRTTSPEIAQAYQRSTLQPGDVVVSIGPSFGKTMVVPQDLAGANLTQGTARVAPAKGFLAEYIQWSLRAPQAIAHWETAVGGATFRALNLEPLGQTPVFMATEADQQAMIQALRVTQREVARLLEMTGMLINRLSERRQALTTAAVTGQLDVEAVA